MGYPNAIVVLFASISALITLKVHGWNPGNGILFFLFVLQHAAVHKQRALLHYNVRFACRANDRVSRRR